jgi:toxin YoeB
MTAMIKVWHDQAWEDYLYWQQESRSTLKRINMLIRDIERSPFAGIGKPEPLKGDLTGWWSRRIDSANRIVYRISDDELEFLQCGGHYRD